MGLRWARQISRYAMPGPTPCPPSMMKAAAAGGCPDSKPSSTSHANLPLFLGRNGSVRPGDGTSAREAGTVPTQTGPHPLVRRLSPLPTLEWDALQSQLFAPRSYIFWLARRMPGGIRLLVVLLVVLWAVAADSANDVKPPSEVVVLQEDNFNR